MIFFSDWTSVLRIPLIGIGSYLSLIVILRISGNRTLSQMNSFDFIVTISLGSVFAAGLLQKSVALFDVLFAFALLVGLQFVTTWLSVRFHVVDRLVKADAVVLFASGTFQHQNMKKSHVTQEEVKAGMRQQGFSTLEQVQFVVLESNGKIVAVAKPDRNDKDFLDSQGETSTL